jgi:hypothetical protein
VLTDPDFPSLGQALSGLPANLKPPVPVTTAAQYDRYARMFSGFGLQGSTARPGTTRCG